MYQENVDVVVVVVVVLNLDGDGDVELVATLVEIPRFRLASGSGRRR
jgi:hypothetical protein